MNKISNKIKTIFKYLFNHSLYISFGVASLFFISVIFIHAIGLDFIGSVYILFIIIFTFTFVCGLIEYFMSIKNDLLSIISVSTMIYISIIGVPYFILIILLTIPIEEVVTIDDEKVFKIDVGFFETDIRYYEYINTYIKGNRLNNVREEKYE